MRKTVTALAIILNLSAGSQALAWGDTGHRFVGEEAMRALPDTVPAFLRSPEAILSVGEFSREPDRWRGAGRVHDSERDAAHFIDLDDEGKSLAGLGLAELPTTRADYEAAVRAKGYEPSKAGYLSYSTIDAYQQIVKDMAYWRVLSYLSEHETDAVKKTWYLEDLRRREALILRDIGILSHYVADATQPMHLSIHYNGWGKYPNPENYTDERIHGPLEAQFISQNVSRPAMRAKMSAYEPCADKVEVCVTKRLTRNFKQIIPLYALEKSGGFKDGVTRGPDYMAGLLGRAASDLRDTLNDAWRDSKTMGVGYPAKTYDEFVAGSVIDPYLLLHGENDLGEQEARVWPRFDGSK